ncbi:excinuclease ABC subunit A [Psittacicella hinzii]|uniref:Excinuclease ABC subunit A n=1 Tax=Psittacicella hinzii TaxID=2028575 RepID=A0A3A1Y2L1_9GAMM|nr:excinuclease ABC subunit A [Psittacicella hinzii]RIY31650.1 excinuclease ABC subunit A [Psittacicella hinzii]
MKLLSKILLASGVILLASCARNDTSYRSIQDALNTQVAKEKVDPNIKLYFAKSVPGKVVASNIKTSRSTNNFNKADLNGCQIAFVSAVLALQDYARKNGATIVSNIVSYYNKVPYASPTQYECHSGTFVGNVVLRADILK